MSRLLRTKAVSAWDYRQMDLSEFCVPFEADRDALAESLLALRKKHAYQIPVDRVEAGDIATLQCRSEKPKFQKDSIPVNVGKNLYSKELEAQLPGLAAGDERTLTVQGAEVAFRVLKVERTVLPELTDEFVSENFKTVHNMAELEDWFIQQQREEHLQAQAAGAAEDMKAQALANSTFDTDEEERATAWNAGDRMVREHWRMNGMPLEEMTDEQAQEIFARPSAKDFADWFANLMVEDLFYAALGWELLAAEGREPTEESYRETVRKMTEEEGASPETMKDYTPYAYARQLCSEHYTNVLKEYAYQIIKEKLS